MPVYQQSVFKPAPKQLQTGFVPFYLLGLFDSQITPAMFNVTHVAIATNVATITVTYKGGGGAQPASLVVVGQAIGVRGTTTSSGAFNVAYATVTAVSLSSAGAGTIGFALTHADVSIAADTGELWALPYETPELTGTSPGLTSAPVVQKFTPDDADNSRCIFAEAKFFGTIPTTCTIQLEVANVDEDSRYLTVENSQGCLAGSTIAASSALATVTAGAVAQSGAEYSFIMGKFIRCKVTALTGADSTTAVVVTIFA